ncbi:hypothetical protein QBC40DRAFT_253751 [Triangularia verruculosa]|uniref:Uncharacterized protein n=1 Tax=Triangularia verruculosa TaxID=2587418 RepID=A0AAN6XJI2_9PEZI|nr:hypothetical protein QBC40DRAFT_253751 [Triangularia verruculosa]
MKFLAIAAVLLPTVTLAQERVKFSRGIVISGAGCLPPTVHPVFSNNDELVTITFDNFRAALPNPREVACSIELGVAHPAGFRRVSPTATLIGNAGAVNLANGVTGELRRNYVIQPTTSDQPSGELRPPAVTWSGPLNTGYLEIDQFQYTQNYVSPGQNRTATIKLNDATLSLQPATGPASSIRLSTYILDISNQTLVL